MDVAPSADVAEHIEAVFVLYCPLKLASRTLRKQEIFAGKEALFLLENTLQAMANGRNNEAI